MGFPIVDALLLCPKGAESGKISICSNTSAPTMVQTEIPENLRDDIAVFARMVVNRDGAERLILNCLSHPSIEYLILFGEETSSFKPSTNLLLALMHGYDEQQKGNTIKKGRGLAHLYPNIRPDLLELFRKRMKVLPLYRYTKGCKEVVEEYLEWSKGSMPEHIRQKVIEINSKKKIYYNHLTELIDLLSKEAKNPSISATDLDPKDFQHLQPPVINLDEQEQLLTVEKPLHVPFSVTVSGKEITVQIDLAGKPFVMRGEDSFLMAYSLMRFMNEHKYTLPIFDQLVLGAELSRIEVLLRSEVELAAFSTPALLLGERQEIPLQARTLLKPDKKYFYKIAVKGKKIAVQSMAHDIEENVFELQSDNLLRMLKRLAVDNRFDDYEQHMLHCVDVGIETARAAIALQENKVFFQDFRNLFSINTTEFPLLISQADSFLTNHKQIITKLYTQGLTMTHPDSHKGTMRTATVLAVYRRSAESLKEMPAVYASGSQGVSQMRESYKLQLLNPDCEPGTHTYGQRTRSHFAKDQLEEAAKHLQENPRSVAVVQRFDFTEDMDITQEPVLDEQGNVLRYRISASQDPCLTHDFYFMSQGKLHSFHVARAHNIVNAYPENIFGLHDAYDQFVAQKVGVELGDMFVLSNRGNILLLTEEQKAKQLISTPSKTVANCDESIGPHKIENPKVGQEGFATATENAAGVYYYETALDQRDHVEHPCLTVLKNYEGKNIIERATRYLKIKGVGHNNPIIGTYNPKQGMITPENRLLFFQANVRGEKIQATAIFAYKEESMLTKDKELSEFLASRYAENLDYPLGKLFVFYIHPEA